MTRKAGSALEFLLQPGVAIPAEMLLHAGGSAYGNALEQNQLEKGDNRMILEAVMQALGAGAGALAGRGAARRAVNYAATLGETIPAI